MDEKLLQRMEAIILSMTPYERENPNVLNSSRKKRIAAGSGTQEKGLSGPPERRAEGLGGLSGRAEGKRR